jgi:hypothetical protein
VGAALVVLVGVGLAAPAVSQAGCLTELDDCGDCASKMLVEAIRDKNLGDLQDAYLYGLDCELDFLHCVFYAKNHTYSCST